LTRDERRSLSNRAQEQGFGNDITDYLLKRKRQSRNMGPMIVRSLMNVLNARPEITIYQTQDYIEGELACCQLADQLYQQTRRVRPRPEILVYTPDTDVLSYPTRAAGQGWLWISNVIPNQHNPNNDNYDFSDWQNDPNSDKAGIWRGIRINQVRAALNLTSAQMIDMFMLAPNCVSEIKGVSLNKAYRLIQQYRNIERIQQANILSGVQFDYVYNNRRIIRNFWKGQAVQ
jgi:hypothetical protein